jgi:threonyl-tRNA synthetase|tara:strand:+ start:221691 stop:223673 length:1983 start_codon:yes stop_codon:yes gene_type:complete
MASQAELQGNISVILPDGSQRELAAGSTGLDLALNISKSLAKASVAIKREGEICDLSTVLQNGDNIAIVKRDDDEGLELIRHDAAHVMAQAVQELFPGTQVTIGPSIDNGFYYDFARAEPFSSDDLMAIEKRMRQIIEKGEAFIREEWARDEAINHFRGIGEDYKAQIIEDLPESETISVYKQGEWKDLCRGPHMPTTKHVGTAFKLMKVAGAYWRGDSKNAMLTRIYGTAWRNDKELKAYLTMLEEAEKRDHRRLGNEMDLFHFQNEAQGSVFWHPRGFTIYNQLEQYMRRRVESDGYVEVKTPQLMHSKFWEISGHWQKYREDMFVVPDVVPNTEEDGPVFKEEPKDFLALKPMNCPAHVQVFKQGIKSYKDLPIRYAEMGCCHRNEAHGALHGLLRVRQFTQDDGHIFCSEEQILDEAVKFCQLTEKVYQDLGFTDYRLTLETRPEMRVGSDELWDKAEKSLMDAMDHIGMEYELCEGDGAFYGPKLGYVLTDAIGREWGCGTLQLDFNLPERFDATYIGEDGGKHRPVMLHRAVLGTFERFIGIMIESYAGKMPLWLAPTQCAVATITESADEYATKLYDELKAAGLRVELDVRNEKINYKVRDHMTKKTSHLFVVGAREAEEDTVAIRRLGSKEQEVISREQAVKMIVEACKPPY